MVAIKEERTILGAMASPSNVLNASATMRQIAIVHAFIILLISVLSNQNHLKATQLRQVKETMQGVNWD